MEEIQLNCIVVVLHQASNKKRSSSVLPARFGSSTRFGILLCVRNPENLFWLGGEQAQALDVDNPENFVVGVQNFRMFELQNLVCKRSEAAHRTMEDPLLSFEVFRGSRRKNGSGPGKEIRSPAE